jgi:gamma-glutamyltranspeptidase / glutathione hydrolase
MASTGLGGGGFALVRRPNGSYDNVDFREAAPAAATEDMFEAPGASSLLSGLARSVPSSRDIPRLTILSGIPGELRGLEYLFKHYASKSWENLIWPSIHLAQYGFPVTEDLLYIFSVHSTDFLVHNPDWSVDFAPNGTLVGLGDTLTRKRYAELLRRIAKEGPDVFYTGDIAEATIAALQAANGTMTVQDLENYTVTTRTPLEISYKDYKITSCGAPSSGAVVLNVMKTIEGYENIGNPAYVNITTHRLDEAIRFGYGAVSLPQCPSFSRLTTSRELS